MQKYRWAKKYEMIKQEILVNNPNQEIGEIVVGTEIYKNLGEFDLPSSTTTPLISGLNSQILFGFPVMGEAQCTMAHHPVF